MHFRSKLQVSVFCLLFITVWFRDDCCPSLINSVASLNAALNILGYQVPEFLLFCSFFIHAHSFTTPLNKSRQRNLQMCFIPNTPLKLQTFLKNKADICSENVGKFSSGFWFTHGAILNPNSRAVNWTKKPRRSEAESGLFYRPFLARSHSI